ncbi:MAG: hypothetical protein M1819_001208 [Sarea resinae]|nr:MAG: hypothetical protein M1819_001208 [Sarea resinae]
MVFKFSHLARQGLAKSFTHGYAQSVVAATQSSYASSTTSFGPLGTQSASRYNKSGAPQFQNAFHSTNASKANNLNANASEAGLSAYYSAWQQEHQEEKEWRQFQLSKRLGLSGPGVVHEIKGKRETDVDGRSGTPVAQDRSTLDRSYSTSAIDDLRREEDRAVEAAAVAEIDAAIAKEIQYAKETALNGHITENVEGEEAIQSKPSSTSPIAPRQSPALTADSVASEASPTSEGTAGTAATSVIDSQSQSQSYSEHIVKLRENQRYAEIPAVFEAMLVAGIKPTAPAYNALLLAAIKLPRARHQVVPKALDVYSDMLRRKVMPDVVTYTTLIDLLSSRALDVQGMKRSLEEKRTRFGGMEEAGKFMFRSHEAELGILADDNSLSIAIKLFDLSTTGHNSHVYSAETYRILVTACAEQGRVDDMIRIFAHMEDHQVIPYASAFSPMIEAFGASKDLSSAVECYNEYKALAVANDNGFDSVLDRNDNDVYASLVKAYALCGRLDGGVKFLGKIVESYEPVTEFKEQRLEAVQDTVVVKALVQASLEKNMFSDALKQAEERSLGPHAYHQAMAKICAAAADKNDLTVATKAFEKLASSDVGIAVPAMSMLALHVRRGEVEAARSYWDILSSQVPVSSAFIEPTAMYAVCLSGSGFVDEGVSQARQMFARVRIAAGLGANLDMIEEIDEGIEFIGRFLSEKAIIPSPAAGMDLVWAMVENGGLVTSVAHQVLSSFGHDSISQLGWKDLTLLLQVQAGMIINKSSALDIAGISRFTQLFENVLSSGMPLDKRTSHLIEQGLAIAGKDRPDLLQQWQNYSRQILEQPPHTPLRYQHPPQPSPVAATPVPAYEDNFDPYGASTDFKGSAVIADMLEKGNSRNGSRLDDALVKFKNMRRAGRHPRYITYAKLISAAGREERATVANDILAMARNDIPLLLQYRVVRYGWASILDAMLGACLSCGNRGQAAQYHQELLDMGSAPTANTFGLYITTLKDSTKTFDEATEAVNIFHRAKSEGVEPSSFLYNALIGKLGKARRIDDCLFYFGEMRSLGIRPTSVTYGTIVNALCRVSDERFAEDLFDEMETTPNYKPRPAPYNSLMQFFLTTKRDRGKVLAYYERMKSKNIQPTMHTYKLLIDTHATLEPVDMEAAEAVLETIRQSGQHPEPVHFASLIHAKGCVLHDMEGARKVFDDVLSDRNIRPQACLYQALFEAMVANHRVADTEALLKAMSVRRVDVTPYIANTLIHGWALEKNITKSKAVYDGLGLAKREPSTYEAMTRAFLSVEDKKSATAVVQEMLSRGYPAAVSGKVLELVGGGHSSANSVIDPEESH